MLNIHSPGKKQNGVTTFTNVTEVEFRQNLDTTVTVLSPVVCNFTEPL
jgi:hypothetical protein